MTIRKQSESGRLAVLGAVLVALAAGAFYLTNQAIYDSTEAATTGAAMSLSVFGETEERDVLKDTEFDVIVNADAIPAGGGDNPAPPDSPSGGYMLAQAWIHWENDAAGLELEFKSSATTWPDCLSNLDLPTTEDEVQDAGRGCATALQPDDFFGSNHKGNLFTFTLTCPNEVGTHTIAMILRGEEPALTNGSAYKKFDQDSTQLDFIDPSVTSMQVNCVETPPEPTVTRTSTIEPPPPPGTPIISLSTSIDDCEPAFPTPTATPTPFIKPITCRTAFFPGQEDRGVFTIEVKANVIPDGGYGGFQSELLFDEGLTYLPRENCEDAEVVWLNGGASVRRCAEVLDIPDTGVTRVRHKATSALTTRFPLRSDVGPLLELDVRCNGTGDQKIVLTTSGTAYIDEFDDPIPVVERNPVDTAADVTTIRCQPAPPVLSLSAFGSGIASCDTDVTDTPTQTTTPTITDTPTPTPTSTLVEPLKCIANFVTNDLTTPDVDESEGTEFKVRINANAIPDGYGGFQLELWHGALKYQANSCSEEVVWRFNGQAGVVCQRLASGTREAVRRISAQTGNFPPLEESKNLGRLLELEFKCGIEGQVPIVLSAFKRPDLFDPVGNEFGSAFFRQELDDPDRNLLDWPPGTPSIQGELKVDQDGDGIIEDTAGPGTPVPEGDSFLVLDLLRINCLAPPAATVTPTITPTLENPPTLTATPKCPDPAVCPTHTPTDTPTQTDTPTSTETPTVTETPTPTQTPAPPDFAQEEVPPGGQVSTGTNAVPSDPIETSVTLPVGGQVSIVEKLIVQPNPTGFTLFGQQVNISAPAGTQQLPLIIQFLIDESIVPDGITAATLPIFKGGVLVPPCAGPAHKASPDPCVAKRNRLTGPAEDDIQITIHTSTASAWNFGQSGGGANPALGDVNGNGSIDPLDALLVLFHTAGMSDVPFPNVADVNSDGRIDPIDATLILQFAAELIGGFTAGTPSGAFWTWLRS